MKREVVAFGLVILIPVAVIAAVVIATWTPPVHPVHTSGASELKANVAGGYRPLRGLVPKPTTSLEAIRCAAWGPRPSQPCPDATTLDQQMWPNLTQTPNTLYVATSTRSGLPYSSTYGFDVEYVPVSRSVAIHAYVSQPLFVWHYAPQIAGVEMAPSIDLLVIRTESIPTGTITVTHDERIERLNGDEVIDQETLGTVSL